MLLTKFINIKTDVNDKNLAYYSSIGYDITKNPISVSIEHLTKGSNYIIDVLCDYCGNKKSIPYKSYLKTIKIIEKYACSKKCASMKSKEILSMKYGVESKTCLDSTKEKMKNTMILKYGVDNAMKSKEIVDKLKNNNLIKYGVEYTIQLSKVRDKSKKTIFDRYGVEIPLKSREIYNKLKKTCLYRYGVDNVMKSKEIVDKLKRSNLIKYGVDNITKCHDFRIKNFIISKDNQYIKYCGNNISSFNCINGHKFEIKSNNYLDRIKKGLSPCTICYPINDHKSIKEKELFNYISSIYKGVIKESYRDLLEIDIFLPEINIGFEFNGLYWHSHDQKDKYYHLNKTNYFKEKGIRIIHIWEDDWDNKKDIVKSQIEILLNLNKKKIFARNCKIKQINDSKLVRNFLVENHIQGFTRSEVSIGLYQSDELVCLMTFNKLEGRKKMEHDGWNLSRFCSKKGYIVVGGASRILKFFTSNYNVKRIVSYADKDWSFGDLYYKLGFNIVSESKPDYKYIVNNKRVHKSWYKKSNIKKIGIITDGKTENQLMKDIGISKVYDCGKIKFEKWH
jgi:hypothetical protein